jgi:hypothetical protein
MDTIPELIDALGGPTAFAKFIGKGASTASEMKRSGRISVDYWPAVKAAAKECGLRGIDDAALARLNLAKPRRRPRRAA